MLLTPGAKNAASSVPVEPATTMSASENSAVAAMPAAMSESGSVAMQAILRTSVCVVTETSSGSRGSGYTGSTPKPTRSCELVTKPAVDATVVRNRHR